MNEVISFSGLEFMVETNIKPKNYKALVLNYLHHKAYMIEKLKGRHDTSDLELEFVKAIRLAERLGIKWTPK